MRRPPPGAASVTPRLSDARLRRAMAQVLGAFLLLTPFILRELNPALEPYPAVLLPVGRETLQRQDGDVLFRRDALGVVLPNGLTERVDGGALIYPIPDLYWKAIALRGFGLPESAPWIRERLAALGYLDASALRLYRERVRLTPRDQGTLTVLSIDSIDFPLHDR